MSCLERNYWKSVIFFVAFFFMGFCSNAQYILIGSCSTEDCQFPKSTYIAADEKSLSGIVDTAKFPDKVTSVVIVVSPESFQTVLNYLRKNAIEREITYSQKWCRQVCLIDKDRHEFFIRTNNYDSYGEYSQNLKDFLSTSEMNKKDSRLIIDNFR